MKRINPHTFLRRAAFTLIELLVVVAVIGILAGLLFPALRGVKVTQRLKLAQAELAKVESAIESYHTDRGTYPPDNPGNFVSNQLYFELEGTVLTNLSGTPTYVTLDGSGQIQNSTGAFQAAYGATTGVSGLINSSASVKGDDDKAAAKNYLKDLKPGQSGVPDKNSPFVKILSCSVLVEDAANYPLSNNSDPLGLNPWRYVSTNPTNNPASYDLWVDLFIGGKKYTVSNWGKKP